MTATYYDLLGLPRTASFEDVKHAFRREIAKYHPDNVQHLGPEFEDPTREIVGIVGDVRENGLDSDPPPVMYVPWYQMSDGLTKLGNSLVPASWIVRSAASTTSLTAEIQKEFQAVDAQLPSAQVHSMNQLVGHRFRALFTFALTGL